MTDHEARELLARWFASNDGGDGVDTADPIQPLWPFWVLGALALLAGIIAGVMAAGGLQ